MAYRIERHNLDGRGSRPVRVYDMPPQREQGYPAYWPAITDVPCPVGACDGTIRWAEAGYVPGYRICDGCRRHFLGGGTAEMPTLMRMGNRRGGPMAPRRRSK